MESNAVMIKPEALMCFMIYTRPDRSHAVPFVGDFWVDEKTARGARYTLGSKHVISSLRGLEKRETYVVAMFPLVQRIAHPEIPEKQILHVTVYYARLSDWPRFTPTEDLTPDAIRAAMIQPNLN